MIRKIQNKTTVIHKILTQHIDGNKIASTLYLSCFNNGDSPSNIIPHKKIYGKTYI